MALQEVHQIVLAQVQEEIRLLLVSFCSGERCSPEGDMRVLTAGLQLDKATARTRIALEV